MLSSKILKDINKYLKKHSKYTKLSNEEYNKLVSDINEITSSYNITMEHSDIISMYNTFVYLLSKTRGTYAHRIGDIIFSEYNNKMKILDIAKKYDLPPMSILRQILIENKYESHNIEKKLKKQSLPKNIRLQMSDIMKHDPSFWYTLKIPNMQSKINKLKCMYVTKYDLSEQGKHPDILFNTECNYNKKRFRWIVFKPYILFDSSLHLHDIQKTVNNFKRFGPGIILYNNIICSRSFLKKIEVNVDLYTFLD